jgi:hypothetical protein
MGQVIRVFDKLTDAPLTSVAELATAGEMFPPVFVGLTASVKSERWKPIGNLPVQGFRLPLFRATSAPKPGTHDNCWLWDGRKERFVGKLSPEQRQLELRLVWGDELLEERIATGENPLGKVQ